MSVCVRVSANGAYLSIKYKKKVLTDFLSHIAGVNVAQKSNKQKATQIPLPILVIIAIVVRLNNNNNKTCFYSQAQDFFFVGLRFTLSGRNKWGNSYQGRLFLFICFKKVKTNKKSFHCITSLFILHSSLRTTLQKGGYFPAQMVKPKVTDLGAGQFRSELECGLQRAATVQLEDASRAECVPCAERIAHRFRRIDAAAEVLAVGI